MLPNNVGDAVTKVGLLRQKLRKVAPDIEEGPKRMQWYVLGIWNLLLHDGIIADCNGQDVARMREMESR